MGERFNSAGINGRDCPLCYRTGTLAGEREGTAPTLKCRGCHTRFRLHADTFGQLERLGTPVPVAPSPFAPQVRDKYNAGARIADDCYCSSCGKRGVIGMCGTCETAA